LEKEIERMSTTEEGSRGSLRLDTRPPDFTDGESAEPQGQADSSSLRARMLRALLEAFGNPRVAIELWNGERVSSAVQPVATLKVSDRSTFLKLCADPDLQFGDAYSEGRIAVEGDLKALLEDLYRGSEAGQGSVTLARRLASTLHRRPSNTLTGSRDNIHHHYDIGNQFYSLWLGSTMAYTCAYFPTPGATLEQAQLAKMDHVCRKVRMKPDDLVVEAGCGWGGLALHMARRFGARVRAFNISQEQIAYAREWAKKEGLADRVEFVLDDYRNISGSYDVFMSVGMLEHVGVENYPELGRVIGRCLRPGGRGLIHTIGRNRPKPMHRWIDRRIFPGANPPSLKQMMDIFEERNFSVLDVENLRLHYARTLHEWHTNFEREVIRVSQMFDDKFVRMWRLYLLGSEAAFTTGELQLFQVAFAPGRSNDVPMTREHLYRA
jgi:cyclopropane-fatty-acyl-phospholipid synthase